MTMNRNILYVVHQERQKTTGIEINVGKSGISIEQK
jgi:hypothetical protein